jgi:hypothetical protein
MVGATLAPTILTFPHAGQDAAVLRRAARSRALVSARESVAMAQPMRLSLAGWIEK